MMKYLVHVMGNKTKSKFFFIIYAEITAIQHLYNTTVSKNFGVHNYCENVSIAVYEMGPVRFFSHMDLESIN